MQERLAVLRDLLLSNRERGPFRRKEDFKRNDIYILEGWVVEALLSELNTLISEQNEKDFNYLTYYGMP